MHDFATHFVSVCTSILGVDGTPEAVEDQGRVTRVEVAVSPRVSMFPILQYLLLDYMLQAYKFRSHDDPCRSVQ